jgi:hypothetical protein
MNKVIHRDKKLILNYTVLHMNSVETILLENIDKPNSLFIFPTDIAASRWADHLLRLKGGTIAMNKFTAWDKFKQNSIKSKVKDKKSIPAALRKIFVCRLISENAVAVKLGKTPFFSSIINTCWAQQAGQFSSWITGFLPQLGAWFNAAAGLSIDCILSAEAEKAAANFKDDDRDMYILAVNYALFLKAHSLFEPAWETPPFNNDGKECFLFFPESLGDYSEYKKLLSQSSHVKIINVNAPDFNNCHTFYYTNSRREITEASLYIRSIHEKQNIEWDSIAVCIPDSKNYEPYVLREFANRNIPFVKRTSKPLSDYPAGCFFRSIFDCTSQDFSFTSLTALILNKNLPWKDTELIDKLIQFGMDNNCLFSWIEKTDGQEQHINVWEEAFKKPVDYYDLNIRKYFNGLKKCISSFRHAKSFIELRKQYFIFREQFFDMEKCTEETDIVLSRCISELMELVELEKCFPDIPAVDPFLFFAEYIDDINYLAQAKAGGVAILPYKTAAAAPFDCHIILGASQDNISIVYPRLSFLPRLKRKELGITDEDASEIYINLHKFNSVKKTAFFCSEQTFSDFAIPHSKINAPFNPEEYYAANPEYEDLFSLDNYNMESTFCTSLVYPDETENITLHENQKNGFLQWKNRRFVCTPGGQNGRKWKIYEKVKNYIDSCYTKSGKPVISATTMHSYNQCSLNWLFQRVFMLKNMQIETSLMDKNISGLVYHAIFENFFGGLKIKNEPLSEPVNMDNNITLPADYQLLLNNSIDTVFNNFPLLQTGKESKMSFLATHILLSAKKDYQHRCEYFIIKFLSFFAGCRIIGCENFYQTETDSYILKGYTDIILKDTSGKCIIVDYKTKKMPKRKDCTGDGENGLSDFQLPVYITLVEENEKSNVYTALFYSILDANPEVIIGTVCDTNTKKVVPYRKSDQIERNSEKYNLIFELFNEKINKYAQEISSGNFTIFPKKTSDCFNCRYHRICRTVYVIERETYYSSEKY